MKSTFELHVNGTIRLDVETGIFPGGEVRVKVKNPWAIQHAKKVVVTAKIRCAAGIQALAQIKSIIDHYGPVPDTALFMGYVPYARQDRVCAEGEANSIKVFAKQINALDFHKVVTVDNHSNVSTALIDFVADMTKEDLFENLAIPYQNYDVFVAPDYGAAKQVQDLARKYNKMFVQGTKNRDADTGKISDFGHYAPESSLDGKSVLIIDDLCDGGGTFLGLAENLDDNHKMKKLSLYVTHGIFSNGTLALTNHFSEVYTTDTYVDDVVAAALAGITVIPIITL